MTARQSPLAGRFDHAIDERQYPSPADEHAIELRAAELLAERLADPARFSELMAGIEPTEIYPSLQRALGELDRACNGEQIAREAVLSSLHNLQRIVKAEAKLAWGDECSVLAEQEIRE